MQGNLQQNESSFLLCQQLKKASKMDHVFLTSSGAMAAENALKIIFQKKHLRIELSHLRIVSLAEQ